ncbi:Zinc finger protein [Castilleja foliolosa]|uniref:Zinc finger protein n=1 Tax=Castilleja foliolosa TaxID=1961234 RepID=A0ABD3DZA0_9LAMI
MGYHCDFCGEQRSIVYCRSDAANLCLSCDRNVHSANALSKRHQRTLVCERCTSQPASVRCINEKISLCQNCDWMGHPTTSLSHKKQAIDCYTGCPSAAELSDMWSFLLDVPSVGKSTCKQGIGSMCITDNGPIKNNTEEESLLAMGKSTSRIESLAPSNEPLHNVDQVLLSGSKGTDVSDDSFYDDFNMDEIDLSIENYEELFGVSVDDGIDGIFGANDMSGSYAAEGSSIGWVNVMQPACSNGASADSVMSCKTEPNLYIARRPYSGISFAGECCAGEHQDCGASPKMGEPPWYPPAGPESSVRSSSRSDAVMRYKEKKKARKFEKKVRYESRKERADVRRRVKGRFIKAGDAYDYDPLIPSRSC